MFVEVVLPIPLADTYTYSIPPEMEKSVAPGIMVLVEFGKNKHYSGIIAYIHPIDPESRFEIKPIIAIESNQPVLRRPQIRFWEWLSHYYLCKLGEVYKAVLPSGFRTESSTNYKQKKETFVRFTEKYNDNNRLCEAFDLVKRAIKQEKLLLSYIECSKISGFEKKKEIKELSKKELLSKSGSNDTILNSLVEKGIFETYEKEISRLETYTHEIQPLNKLNPLQQEAYTGIVQSFREKDVCLLHGVTSAGKTEIYTHLIAETLKLNRQTLILLPEIALTAQITGRLKRFFGNKLGVYHSKVSDNERVEIWNNLLNDESYRIILGVRSSIFLPFRDLGLIIVDEEHEPSYKQQDPAPRYHARNAAIVLATMHSAKVVLGSATPSIESYFNAQTGKYGYVELNKRFEDTELPLITPVNVKELRRKKRMKSLFSPLLIEKMQEALENGEQILLFQNRRGFAPMISCKICDWTPKCRFCDVSLTYHKRYNQLTCHYCGSTYPIPSECPECGNKELKPQGFGTEKVEEEILQLFPETKVDRMDADTTKNKKSFEEIITRFEQGKTQILIGTQMISKGLDFEKVSLVGILNADSLMSFPDFRAYERAYQLMSQVSGRAGRRKKQGEVVLQTSHPEHPIIQTVLDHNYTGMYQTQIEERQLFHYPPFYRLININLKHKNEDLLKKMASEYANLLRNALGDRVMGPDKPPVSRIQSFHIQKILLKIEISASLNILHKILEDVRSRMLANSQYKYAIIQYDVDPV
ncbi:MAG: primosomal protein N' [Dysgonamonadaceae bacterium]|jgi:primosomal protein N' (replication factor Y)|nr:primosomal protein N' [Dysgonamonadaceae bacterium]